MTRRAPGLVAVIALAGCAAPAPTSADGPDDLAAATASELAAATDEHERIVQVLCAHVGPAECAWCGALRARLVEVHARTFVNPLDWSGSPAGGFTVTVHADRAVFSVDQGTSITTPLFEVRAGRVGRTPAWRRRRGL